RKSAHREIDDVIWAHRSMHIRRRLPPGAPVALEGRDILHIRRPCRAGLSYHTYKDKDNEMPHHVILLQLTPAMTARDPTQLVLLPHEDQQWVGGRDVALAVRAEHGEGVVARLQILDDDPGRPLRQLGHLCRPIVQLQLLPARELGVIHSYAD